MRRPYAVYILCNRRRTTLYVGVTRDLSRRLHEHRTGVGSRFVHRYQLDQLVHVEWCDGGCRGCRRRRAGACIHTRDSYRSAITRFPP